MLTFTQGNIFAAGTEAVVNPVNCVGAMGAGLALKFRQLYPNMFDDYRRVCRAGGLRPGVVFTYNTSKITPRYVINVPTKIDWRDPSTLSDVCAGLQALAQEIERLGIKTIAVPALGCGLGRLLWDDVQPCFERYLGHLDAEITVFEPDRS